jgi:hypothetical protein
MGITSKTTRQVVSGRKLLLAGTASAATKSGTNSYTSGFALGGAIPDASTSLVTSWTLNITAVPEPVNVALGLFGGLAGVAWGFRRLRSYNLKDISS